MRTCLKLAWVTLWLAEQFARFAKQQVSLPRTLPNDLLARLALWLATRLNRLTAWLIDQGDPPTPAFRNPWA
jgi:hypothetical protein